MKYSCLICLMIFASCFLCADEKLLFGFEEAEVQKLLEISKCKAIPGKTDKDPTIIDFSPYRWQQTWSCFKDFKTQGELSLGLSVSKLVYGKLIIGNEPERLVSINSAFTPGRGTAFRTIGILSDLMDVNWSNYEVFRFDVYSMLDEVTISVYLEDDRISPALKYVFPAKKNSWVTCEIDIAEAIKAREFNPAKIASLNIRAFADTDTNAIALPIRLDNFRLANGKDASKNEIVKNKEPILPLEFNFSTSNPKKEELPKYNKNISKLEKPEVYKINTDKVYGVLPVGWVTAYDNDHLLIGYCSMGQAGLTYMQQTLDGGKTWTGLGKTEPTSMKIPYNDHQSGTSCIIGERKDVVLTTNLGCAGPLIPSIRLFARHIQHQENGWVLRDVPSFVDSDLRHCNSDQTMFRGKDGRIWLAYGYAGRLGQRTIALRYSDDDGITYHSTIKNTNGLIPESVRNEKGYYGYNFEEAVIVPFQTGVMIIWGTAIEEKATEYKYMTFVDGKWSALQKIAIPAERVYTKMRPPLSAVVKNNGEIIVASTEFNGLLVYKENQWKLQANKLPAGVKIALAGGEKLFGFAMGTNQSYEYVNKKPIGKISMYTIDNNYEISTPKEIVSEEHPFSIQGSNMYYARTALTVDAYSPANFIAIAWTCIDQKWVKVMKIPVE